MLEETGVDIVIQNGGGIRADIAAGQVTLGECLDRAALRQLDKHL